MKVAELIDDDLDHWVATADKWEIVTMVDQWGIVILKEDGRTQEYSPSTSWMQGGPIIEREKISIVCDHSMMGFKNPWIAQHTLETGEHEHAAHKHIGSTALEAAMRCYVDSIYGESVPDEVKP